MAKKIKGKDFELEVKKFKTVDLAMPKFFTYENEKWNVTSQIKLSHIEGEDDSNLGVSSYLYLCKASNGSKEKYAVLYGFYDQPDHFSLYVLRMENTHMDAEMKFASREMELVGKMNVSSELKELLKRKLKDMERGKPSG